MIVLFIYGPAAAGKHTIGSLVATGTGMPLFHNHLTVDLAATLFEFGSSGFRHLRADVWRAAFREAARERKSFIFTFHPEATVESHLVDELSQIIVSGGGSIFFVELLCAHSTVLGRLTMESRRRFGKLTDPDLYEKIRSEGGFEFAGLPRPDLRIDTESTEPGDAAKTIIAALAERGLLATPGG